MVNRNKMILSLVASGVAVAIAIMSCGKKSSDDDAATTVDAVTANPAALAYPSSLSIQSFPSTTSTSLVDTVDPTDATGTAKKTEQDKIISGTAESCLPKVMDQKDQDITADTCYEFDQEMIYGTKTPTGKTASTRGTTDGKNSAGEACLVAFARGQVKRIVGQVDRSLALAQMALCQRKKDGETAPPAVGVEVDLAPALKKVMVKGTVNSAKMKRLADASDGAKVFTMSFDTIRPDNTPMVVTFTHSPKNDANTSFTGVFYAQISELDPSGTKASKTRLLSIVYDRSDTKMKYSLRTGRFPASLLSSGVGTDGQVDFNVGISASNEYSSDTVEGMTAIAFEGNPTTNEGTFSYWQNPGGTYSERARGMLASMTYDTATSTLAGCAVSGAASTSIRASIKDSKTLEPTGAFHPFFHTETDNSPNACGTSTGPTTDSTGDAYSRTCSGGTAETRKWYVPTGLSTNGTTFVTQQQPAFYSKQCFKQNSAGVFAIDTALTPAAAGFELIATTDTAKKISPPAGPAPGAGVKKQ